MPSRRPIPASLISARAFRLADAEAAGVSRSQLRGSPYSRPFRGVHSVGQPDSVQAKCAAALLALPKQAVFSDETAAELFGLPLPPGPHPIHVSVPATESQVRRRGMVGHVRALEVDEITQIGGLPVSSAARTYLDLAARLPRGMLLALGDALLHRRLVRMDELVAITDAHKGYRGVVRARATLDLLDAGSESPRESILRLLLLDAGLRDLRPMPTSTTSTEPSSLVLICCFAANA
jgi:hypothetical protein